MTRTTSTFPTAPLPRHSARHGTPLADLAAPHDRDSTRVLFHAIAHDAALGEIPPTGLKPHTDVLTDFPYLGTPHHQKS